MTNAEVLSCSFHTMLSVHLQYNGCSTVNKIDLQAQNRLKYMNCFEISCKITIIFLAYMVENIMQSLTYGLF